MTKRLLRILLALAAACGMAVAAIWLLAVALEDREPTFEGKRLGAWRTAAASDDPALRNRARTVVETAIVPRLIRTMLADTNDFALKFALVDKLNALPGVRVQCVSAEARRAGAAAELGAFGSWAKSGVAALAQAFQGTDAAVRGPAALALGQIRAEPEKIVPLLIAALDDPDVRAEAAEALGDYGAMARAAVPKLVALLAVREKQVQHGVRLALPQIDPAAAAAAGVASAR